MADPVTNVDIEDVLASIRRLVLQGPPGAPPPPPVRNRLVLTQALRVEGPEEETEVAPPAAEARGLDEPEVEPQAEPEPQAVEPGPAAMPPLLVLSTPLPAGGRADDLRGIEAALSDAPDAWEPDGSEDLDWSLGGVAEAAPAPVFRHRAPDAPAAPPPEAAAPLDEARLRAMVTEVLRAELQGELGERMTRNIRKLVRREIFRVLETRDDE